jgi:hypothetical protein
VRDECDVSMGPYEIDRDKPGPLHQQHRLRVARQSLTRKAAHNRAALIGGPDSAKPQVRSALLSEVVSATVK